MEGLSEPPSEIRAEIQAGLDEIYRPDAETDEVGPEVVLTSAQAETAICRYVTQRTEPGQWYYGDYADYGPLLSVEEDTGISDAVARKALQQCIEKGLLAKQGTTNRSGERIDALLATESGWQTVEAAKPEDIETIDAYIKRSKRRLALLVRDEIASERFSLGVSGPYDFENVMQLDTIAELDEHLAWLREVQSDLLDMIDEIEKQETPERYRPKTYQ